MRGRLHDPDLDFWQRLDKSGDCWLWTGSLKPNGYGQLSVGRGIVRTAHRYCWFLTHGEWPKLSVLHHCDTRHCCNPAHLYVGTHEDNMRDMRARNREANGGRLPQTKLTHDAADDIRGEYAKGGISMKSLGRRYGVGPQTVCDIVHQRRWT